jgi:CheY-like chemotaxis protein
MSIDFHGDILPFQFPTTTLLIDDHEKYLDSVPLLLDPALRLRSYSSPRKALAELGSHGIRAIPGGGWMYHWKDRSSQTRELVALDIDSIHRVMFDPERFAEVAVVVVDLTMPEMDGIAFCRALANPHIGKILLTGTADDCTAIEAFNAGVIDRFIRKSDPLAMDKLQQGIRALQRRYFERVGGFVAEALALGNVRFLRDPAFQQAFRGLVGNFPAVECYLHVNPTGMLLLDDRGRGRFVLVQTDEDLRAHYEIASDLGAPAELLAALREGDRLPWFGDGDGYYREGIERPESRLLPAVTARGEQWYHLAWIEDVARFQLGNLHSYHDWLGEQDGQALGV